MHLRHRSVWAIACFTCLAAISSFACSDDDPTPAPAGTSSSSGGTSGGTSGATSGGTSGGTSGTPAATKDIVDTAAGAGNFKTLVAAVQAAGLVDTLKGTGPFTVFAPTDDAFAKVPKFLTDKLLTAPYKGELGLILKYHVLSGNVKAADVLNKTSTPDTVLGAKLDVNGSGGKVVINGSTNVTTPDVAATNGTIHAIDGVLLPTIADTAIGYDDGTTTFKTLVAALTAGELAATLGGPGPYTVFAPTDAAFAKIPKATLDNLLLPANKAQLQAILKLHVIAGNPVYEKDVAAGNVNTLGGPVAITITGSNVELSANGGGKAKVILTDLPASNGVTHVIDTVILPP